MPLVMTAWAEGTPAFRGHLGVTLCCRETLWIWAAYREYS